MGAVVILHGLTADAVSKPEEAAKKNTPASTAAGILEAKGANAMVITNKRIPAIIPDNLVLPPELIFTTVRIVAPAPGIPPKMAPMELPIP